jgi:hypothetical protein
MTTVVDTNHTTHTKLRADLVLEQLAVHLYEDQALADVTLTRLRATANMCPCDTRVNLSLRSLIVSDTSNGRPKRILYNQSEQSNLLDISLVQKQDDTTVQLQFHELQVYYEPIFLRTVLALSNKLQNTLQEMNYRTKYYSVVQPVVTDSVSTKNILLRLKQLDVYLMENTSVFAQLSMCGTQVQARIGSDTLIEGKIDDLKVEHCEQDALHREILGLVDARSLISFSYYTSLTEKKLKLQMESIKIVYLARTIAQFNLYFANNSLSEPTAATEAVATPPVTPPTTDTSPSLQLDVTLVNAIIIVPDHYQSPDKWILTMNKLQVSNDPNLSVKITDMNLSSMQSSSVSSLVDTNISVDITYGTSPATLVNVMVKPKQQVTLSHLQYQQIFEILYKNLWSVKKPPAPYVDRTALVGFGTKVVINIPHANATLLRSDKTPLARLDIHGLIITYQAHQNCKGFWNSLTV